MSIISYLIKIKKTSIREKRSPFECGFDTKHKFRASFSLRFFIITILFLIFDAETAVLLPLPLNIRTSNQITFILTSLLIFLILSLGLALEWSQGALEW
jgi:NADH:ubiquinone oxidoreductase subunit 3 (subunit A)